MSTTGEPVDKKPLGQGMWVYLRRLFSDPKSLGWQAWLLWALLGATLALIVHSLMIGGLRSGSRIAAGAILIAVGAGAVGVLLGFLFGIPRSLQQDAPSADKGSSGLPQSTKVNTNLEQISDWLTKIIVGVGLTQAGAIGDGVLRMATKLGGLVSIPGQADADAANGVALVLVIIVLFSIQGFLQGYLWGRIYLQETFTNLELKAKRQPEYYEGLMNSYLYMDAPRSFMETFSLRDQFREAFGDNLTDRMWTYLACAYGQKYIWDESNGVSQLELAKLKKQFIEVLKRALRGDREAKALLRLELIPGKKEDPRLFDGDLRAFSDDAEIKGLLSEEQSP